MSQRIIEYIEEAPGLIRIKPSIDGLFTMNRYIQIAKDLLNNGFPQAGEQNLKDENSIDFTDNMLLEKELNERSESTVKTVVFSLNGTDYFLNLSNIEKFNIQENREKRNPGENTEAMLESIQEMFTR